MQGKPKGIQTARTGAYRFGAFELHPSDRQLYRHDKRVALPPKAFDALLLMVRHADRLVRKDELMRELWPDTFVEEANLTNTVVTLRKALGKTTIETVSKFGYRFTLPVTGEPGIDPDTYATFIRAKQAFARSVEAVTTARDLFALAVAQDPAFAAAWAWLGRCYRFLEKFGVEPSVNFDLAQAAFRRALALDPQLAVAHQFYTQLQADTGHARDAMLRLATRIRDRGGDAESHAGLVQVLRFCGLLEASVAAHQRAIQLDPTVVTSVPHTFFLLGDFQSALATYRGVQFYLDASACAGLGETERARTMLRERLDSKAQSAITFALLDTLLSALEGRGDDVVRVIQATTVTREPEVLFYLARHCAIARADGDAIALIRRARVEGLVCSHALRHHAVFAHLRSEPAFRTEVDAAVAFENEARAAYARITS
jgi:DNA-binding winged helix-turn-helix (wHTH) protein